MIKFSTAEQAWDKATAHLQSTGRIITATGIVYNAWVTQEVISYQAETRSNGVPETIGRSEFISAVKAISRLPRINTSSVKDVVPKSLYRKRSPLIAILKCRPCLSLKSFAKNC